MHASRSDLGQAKPGRTQKGKTKYNKPNDLLKKKGSCVLVLFK